LDEGKKPFFMNATAGTTVMGGFDPFEKIAAICKKNKIWFHVDGCWGGTSLFSEKYENLYKGIHLSDSLALD
jgi:glutamate/tyrosine decarboxylase-like PLP-dependent enzyme